MDLLQVVNAYVGLGANLGNPVETIRRALHQLGGLPDTELAKVSSLYRSAPLGHAAQPQFVNAVAKLRTGLSARALLESLLTLESHAGRKRSFPNAPRTLDLDLLLYGGERIDEPGLCVPHPRMHQRRFVLEPLLEIEPECVIPGLGPARDALPEVLDQMVMKLEPAQDP